MGTVVFAVDRQQFRPVLSNGLHHQAPAGDQHFLIGESHAFAEADRFIGGFQTGDAYDGGNHGIHFDRPDRLYTRSVAPSQLRPFGSRQPGRGQTLRETCQTVGGRDHRQFGAEFQDLSSEDLDVVAGHQRVHLV